MSLTPSKSSSFSVTFWVKFIPFTVAMCFSSWDCVHPCVLRLPQSQCGGLLVSQILASLSSHQRRLPELLKPSKHLILILFKHLAFFLAMSGSSTKMSLRVWALSLRILMCSLGLQISANVTWINLITGTLDGGLRKRPKKQLNVLIHSSYSLRQSELDFSVAPNMKLSNWHILLFLLKVFQLCLKCVVKTIFIQQLQDLYVRGPSLWAVSPHGRGVEPMTHGTGRLSSRRSCPSGSYKYSVLNHFLHTQMLPTHAEKNHSRGGSQTMAYLY